MNFCVVGGGKMGLSHLALITPYLGKTNTILVERKRAVRLVFRMLGYKTFGTLDAFVKKMGKPQGIIIATPTSSHAALAEWAIANRVPFFVEKPLTLDAKRSARLVELANQSRVRGQTGFVMRYVSTFQRLRVLINDGHLGELKKYRASMRGNVMVKPPSVGSWQGDYKRGGGVLNEYGPHIIDLCRFIFGDIAEIARAEYGKIHCTDADDWIDLDWHHESGVQGALQINWCDTSKRKSVIEIDAEFDLARVRVDNSAIEFCFNDGIQLDDQFRADLLRPPQPPNVGFFLRGEEFSLELEDFLGACLSRRVHVGTMLLETVTPTLEDGCAVDELIESIARKAGLE